jgi:hypothetical protein
MIVGICHEAVLSLLFHEAATPKALPVTPQEVDALVTIVLNGISR